MQRSGREGRERERGRGSGRGDEKERKVGRKGERNREIENEIVEVNLKEINQTLDKMKKPKR